MWNRRSVIGAIGIGAFVGLAGPAISQETYIPLISKGFQHQFWQAVKVGAEQAAKDLNVRITFEGPDSETMVDKQIDMLSAALAKNPKAIVCRPRQPGGDPPAAEGASRQDPRRRLRPGVESDIPVTTAATNNLAAALAADKLAELIGGEGDIAAVVHDQTSRTGIDRRDGFVNRIKEKHPKINIVSVQYGSGDHLKSTEITKSILQANPRASMFGANEGSAIGVVNGAKELNRRIVIVGYDSGKQQKQAIRDGLMAGAITQNPVGIGYKTVEAAVKAIKGEKLEKVIDTGSSITTSRTSTTRRSPRSCTIEALAGLHPLGGSGAPPVSSPAARSAGKGIHSRVHWNLIAFLAFGSPGTTQSSAPPGMTLSASYGAAPVFLDASSVILERRPTPRGAFRACPSAPRSTARRRAGGSGRIEAHEPQGRLDDGHLVPLCSSARRFSKPEIASIGGGPRIVAGLERRMDRDRVFGPHVDQAGREPARPDGVERRSPGSARPPTHTMSGSVFLIASASRSGVGEAHLTPATPGTRQSCSIASRPIASFLR